MRTKEEYSLLAEKLLANTYKPHQLLQEELIEAFVVRLKVFERLYRDISTTERTSFGPHYLIEGQRGMGKTTLLLRLCYELERDKNLPAWLLPLALKEEQYYSITRLSDLWQRIIEVLADSYPKFEKLENDLEKYSYVEDDREVEKAYFELLVKDLNKKNKKLVLFMDNMGVTFERFNEYEQQRLRQIMQTYSEIQFIGASHKIWDNYANYSKPFYDFFKVEKLKALTSEEINTLLQKLAEGNEKLDHIIRTQRTRIEVMRTLTGGNIRTTLLVFQALAQDEDGQALQDLEFLLNEVTPYYKARLDDLTPLEQNVIDALATHWGSMTLAEVAKKLRRSEPEVEKELERLSQTIWLDKMQETPETLLYRISERFFNIWYLMRMSRTKDRNRVEWFVKMLEVWFDYNTEELNSKAQEHIKNLENPDYIASSAYTMTQALLHTGLIKWDTQEKLLEATKSLLERKDKYLAGELSEADSEIVNSLQNVFNGILYEKTEEEQQEIAIKCLDTLKKVKNKNDENGGVWYIEFVFYNILKKEEESILCLEKALSFPNALTYYKLMEFYITQKKYTEANELIKKYQLFDNREPIVESILYFSQLIVYLTLNKIGTFTNLLEEFIRTNINLKSFADEFAKNNHDVFKIPLLYTSCINLFDNFNKNKLNIEKLEIILSDYNAIKNDFHSHCILALFYLNLKIDKEKYIHFAEKIAKFKTKNEVDKLLKLMLLRFLDMWNGNYINSQKELINSVKFYQDIEGNDFLIPIFGKIYAKIIKMSIAKKSRYLNNFASIPHLVQDNEIALCFLIAPYYALTDSPKIYDFFSKVPPYQLKDIERIMAEIAQMRIDYA